MKKTLKIFCCVLAVCSVNVGVVKADTINNEKLWNWFQQDRENSIANIINDENVVVKGVYWDTYSDENEDKRVWKDGDLIIKMQVTEKQSQSIFKNIIEKIWYKRTLTEEDIERANTNKKRMDEMEKYEYSPLGMSIKEKIYSRYSRWIGVTVNSKEEDGKISFGWVDSRIEELVNVDLLNGYYAMYYKGSICKRNYEKIVNAVAGESKIRINSKDYELNSPVVLSNGTMYIPVDGVKIILDRYGKEIDSQLSSVCKEIDGINYYPYRNVINAGEDNTNQIFFDLDTKMASSLSMNLSEARDTVFGLFYD
ncbi:unknown [Eubacterium sp. CAG:274]|nr:unknown [Eubacterium sp. CAG:274]